jgi:hypothetical protein
MAGITAAMLAESCEKKKRVAFLYFYRLRMY